jgi:hypothetical protein
LFIACHSYDALANPIASAADRRFKAEIRSHLRNELEDGETWVASKNQHNIHD